MTTLASIRADLIATRKRIDALKVANVPAQHAASLKVVIAQLDAAMTEAHKAVHAAEISINGQSKTLAPEMADRFAAEAISKVARRLGDVMGKTAAIEAGLARLSA